MKYYLSTAFLDSDDIIEVAREADRLGFDGLGIPDHVINFESLTTPYPYTGDGARRWPAFTHWPDPWVLIAALAQVTTRLRFVTTVYILSMRDPYIVARAVRTLARMTGGRVALGVGVGWCEEEFALMGQPFHRRGRRTDEMLTVMRDSWQPARIPVLVGGQTDIALRRAVRNDGWVGSFSTTTEQAIDLAGRLRAMRVESGMPVDDFTILTPLVDASGYADYERAEAAGVTHVLARPWRTGAGVAEMVDGMRKLCADRGVRRLLG